MEHQSLKVFSLLKAFVYRAMLHFIQWQWCAKYPDDI